ncbi:MAG TPA: hypothetical protein VJ506_07725 [Candidatus Limnocylindrales bacterium]|nr:hypothetical protein [Candidatus Limnocylindrales bacterium]
MSGTQLAMLATIGWAIVTVALLVIGTSRVGVGWTILPGLVRGARDWVAAQAATRSASPSPWAVSGPAAGPRATDPSAGPETPPETSDDVDLEAGELVEIEDLGTRSI